MVFYLFIYFTRWYAFEKSNVGFGGGDAEEEDRADSDGGSSGEEDEEEGEEGVAPSEASKQSAGGEEGYHGAFKSGRFAADTLSEVGRPRFEGGFVVVVVVAFLLVLVKALTYDSSSRQANG